jgi:hypothetical protein
MGRTIGAELVRLRVVDDCKCVSTNATGNLGRQMFSVSISWAHLQNRKAGLALYGRTAISYFDLKCVLKGE